MSIERVGGLRRNLAEKGYDAFVSVARPTNQYFTGFRGSTSGVLVTQDAAYFLCDFRYAEQAAEQVQDYTVLEVRDGLSKRLGELLKEAGVTSAAFEPEATTVQQLNAIEEAFGASLTADSDVVASLRSVKSAEEVRLIRDAMALAEGVLADLLGTLEAGLTERELAAAFEYEFKKRGASGASFDTIALFGARSSLPHGEPGDKVLEAGDIVLLDFGCRKEGYCSDLTRTYVFGTMPGPWFEDIYTLTQEAQQRAIEAVKPGAVAREVDGVARSIIASGGHAEHFGHGLGHGVGIEVHEAPRLGEHAACALEPGMVVTVEPGIYLPGRGGVRIEDLVVVTDDGCELLSTAPKELRILPA